jgi:hypothetical protein
MFDALRARFGRSSTDDTKDREREGKRAERAVACQKAQEHDRQLRTKAKTEVSRYEYLGGGF